MPTLIQKLVALGAETFLALKDTPASFDGQQGRFAKVDPTEAKLVFGDPFESDGLLGAWVYGTAATNGEFDFDNTNPTLATLININFNDTTGDKQFNLDYQEPDDRLEIHAQVGDKKYFYHINSKTVTATGVSFGVTYIGGDTSSLTAGDTFNIYGAVFSTINLGAVRFRPIINPPAGAVDGTVYFDGTNLMLRSAGAWVQLN
jgi:hypothetical protein